MNAPTHEKNRSDMLAKVLIWVMCFIAISPSLGTAVAAIGRLLLYVIALGHFSCRALTKTQSNEREQHRIISFFVLSICMYMALSVLWSDAETEVALISWSRHARLLSIPIVYLLLRDATTSRTVIKAFIYGQVFVVISSWLLVLGIHAPWVTALHADDTYAVFGSYLEQSISQAVLAALLWHQRDTVFGRRGQWIAIAMSAATLILTVGFLPGRSGHLVALGLTTLVCLHAIPRRYKWTAALIPFLAVAIIGASSSNFRERMMQVSSEITAYTQNSNADTSSGERIFYWKTSIAAIAERPLFGFGAGSWNKEYRRLEGGRAAPGSLTVDNPHQLFLLWAVDGGLIGLALLCGLLTSIWTYSHKLQTNDALSLQAMVAALVISSMFNSMIYGIGMGDFFCVGLGILMALRPKTTDEQHVPH